MLYTIIGDIHCKPDNLEKVETLFDMIEDLRNPAILLGDTLDTKEIIRGKCLNLIYRRLRDSKLHFYIIIGNHCLYRLDGKEHSLEALKSLSNVTIIDEPTTITLGKTPCRFYPYIHDVSLIKADFEQTKDKVAIGHFEISMFDYGNGHIAEGGMQAADFKSFPRVISGHFHKYQNVENITYLGTPFSHSFGESNQEKFLGLYDPDADTLELIPTPFPQHRTHEIDCSKNDAVAWNLDDINRVILNGTQEEIDRFPKAEGVKYIEKPTTEQAEAVVSETDTPEVQFAKWATEIKGYSKSVLNLGLEVLKNV